MIHIIHWLFHFAAAPAPAHHVLHALPGCRLAGPPRIVHAAMCPLGVIR